jgi:hypothetical protein
MIVGHVANPDGSNFRKGHAKVSNDLVKHLRKLRWIGVDGEAEFLQIALRYLQAAERNRLLMSCSADGEAIQTSPSALSDQREGQ